MPRFNVRWEIDLDAENPIEAAQMALRDLRSDPDQVFTVARKRGKYRDAKSEETVNLGDLPVSE